MIKKKGFTLVELLAVIVILAIILVIAVPQIMDTIDSARIASLESSAKMVAAQVEKQYTVSQTLGTNFPSGGDCTTAKWAGLNNVDYESCTYGVDITGKAIVRLVGKGKLEGKKVCNGTKVEAEVSEEACSSLFEQHDWNMIVGSAQSGTNLYQVGDSKEIEMDVNGDGVPETYTIRIANLKSCKGVNLASHTACGFVLEFADIITTRAMNEEETNKGGWPASDMRMYLNNNIYNSLPQELRNGIIDTKVISSRGMSDASNFTSTDKIYLLSPEEVIGTSFTHGNENSIGTSRQLDYYVNNRGAKKNSNAVKAYWWLRSAHSGSDRRFFYIDTAGNGSDAYSPNVYGVSPAFRIAE